MTNQNVSREIKEKVPLILAEIQNAKSILLHCHPSPDPDSVGSALAMRLVLEQLGKKATVIKGDSEIPQAFMHFPGAKDILMKSYWEINPADYDLFIILDSALTGVSRLKAVVLPEAMRVVNIDHHRTSKGDGQVNIIDTSYPANTQLLFDIFSEMKVEITSDIAANLFVGIYTDTAFKYDSTTARTFEVAAELVRICPTFNQIIANMENSNTLGDMAFRGVALSNLESACNGNVLLSTVSYPMIQEKNIPDVSISAGVVSSIIRTVAGFHISVAILEPRPNKIKLSFRADSSGKYDVSIIAAALGGGGHKAAAGASLEMSLDEAKRLVVSKAKELYNL